MLPDHVTVQIQDSICVASKSFWMSTDTGKLILPTLRKGYPALSSGPLTPTCLPIYHLP